MSDPYSPYSPQPYSLPAQYGSHFPPMRGSGAGSNSLTKSVAALMIALAALALLLGLGMILMGLVITPQLLAEAQVPPELHESASMAGVDVLTLMKWTAFIGGGILVTYAIVFGGLSPSIWKGRRWAACVALGFLVLVVLLQLLNVIASLGDPLSMCIGVVMVLPHLVLGVLLVKMLAAGPREDWAAEQRMAMEIQAQQLAWQQYYAQQQAAQARQGEQLPPSPH